MESTISHNFTTHAIFTIIEKLEKIPHDKATTRSILEHKEHTWMLRTKTIFPNRLNVRLNHPKDVIVTI